MTVAVILRLLAARGRITGKTYLELETVDFDWWWGSGGGGGRNIFK